MRAIGRPPGSPFGALRPSGCWEATSRGHHLKPTRRSRDAPGPVGRPPVPAGLRPEVDDRRSGNPVPSPAVLGKIGRDYVNRVNAFIAANEIPTVRFVK